MSVVFEPKKVGELSEKMFLLCWDYSFRKVTTDLARREGRGHCWSDRATDNWERHERGEIYHRQITSSVAAFQLKS